MSFYLDNIHKYKLTIFKNNNDLSGVIIEAERELLVSMYAVCKIILQNNPNSKIEAIKAIRKLARQFGEDGVGLKEARYFVNLVLDVEDRAKLADKLQNLF